MKRYVAQVACLSMVVMLAAAAGCGSGKRVTRLDPSEVVDLSGRWNDTDSQQVAQKMIMDCLNHVWITQFTSSNGGKKPVVIVGSIRNRGMEHIPAATFITDIERAFVNSGRVSVVAGAEERNELRDERLDQRANASLETIKEMGMELGADYMMTGEVNTIEDREGGEQILFYQVDLTLTNIETNEKVWIRPEKLKKYIQRKRTVL